MLIDDEKKNFEWEIEEYTYVHSEYGEYDPIFPYKTTTP